MPTHLRAHIRVLGITNRNGAFAEYTTLPVENLYVVPESVATEIATFTEPLAAALQVLEQVILRLKTAFLSWVLESSVNLSHGR